MSGEIESVGTLIYFQFIQLAVVGLPAILTMWLLRTRWLAHLPNATALLAQRWLGAPLGALTAIAALVITIVPAVITGSYRAGHSWQAFQYSLTPSTENSAGGLLLLFLVQSLFEEALFRGIGLALLAMLLMWVAELLWLPAEKRRFGTRSSETEPQEVAAWRMGAWFYCGLLANIVVAGGFGLVHSSNPNISPVALVNILLAGMWLGLLLWRTCSLLAAWAGHFVWNAALALLSLPVSGYAILRMPLGFGISGAMDGLLTGGQFGPEGSLLCTVAFTALTAWLTHSTLSQLRTKTIPTSSESGIAAEKLAG